MSALEGSLVRPPFEALSQVVRNSQKIVLKDLTQASATAKALHSSLSKPTPSTASLASADKSIASLISSITALKRKLEDTEKAAWKASKALAIRLDFLAQLEAQEDALPPPPSPYPPHPQGGRAEGRQGGGGG